MNEDLMLFLIRNGYGDFNIEIVQNELMRDLTHTEKEFVKFIRHLIMD